MVKKTDAGDVMNFHRTRFNFVHMAVFLLAVPLAMITSGAQVKAGQQQKSPSNKNATSNDQAETPQPNLDLRQSIICEMPNILSADDLNRAGQKNNSTQPHLDLHQSIIADIPILFYKEQCFTEPVEEDVVESSNELLDTFVATAYCIKNTTACGVM